MIKYLVPPVPVLAGAVALVLDATVVLVDVTVVVVGLLVLLVVAFEVVVPGTHWSIICQDYEPIHNSFRTDNSTDCTMYKRHLTRRRYLQNSPIRHTGPKLRHQHWLVRQMPRQDTLTPF